jgi:hypothetical protein
MGKEMRRILDRAIPNDKEHSEWLDYLRWKRHLTYDNWTRENQMEAEELADMQEARLNVCTNTAIELNTKKGLDLRALSPCAWDCCFLCGCDLTALPERDSYVLNGVHVHESGDAYAARLRSIRSHRVEEHNNCMDMAADAVGCKVRRLDENFPGYRLLCKTEDDEWYSLEFPDVFAGRERPRVKEVEQEIQATGREQIGWLYPRPYERYR